jgi:hypothetical protein
MMASLSDHPTVRAFQAKELLVDQISQEARAALAADPHALNRQMQQL